MFFSAGTQNIKSMLNYISLAYFGFYKEVIVQENTDDMCTQTLDARRFKTSFEGTRLIDYFSL